MSSYTLFLPDYCSYPHFSLNAILYLLLLCQVQDRCPTPWYKNCLCVYCAKKRKASQQKYAGFQSTMSSHTSNFVSQPDILLSRSSLFTVSKHKLRYRSTLAHKNRCRFLTNGYHSISVGAQLDPVLFPG